MHFVKLDKINVKERWQHLIIKFKHEFVDFHLKHIFNFQYFEFRIQGGRWIISRTEKTSSATIANHFNLHFAEVGTKLVNNLPPTSHNFKEYLPLPSSNSLYFNSTSPLEIKKIITDLKSKNSSGMDGIPSKALKCTPDNILWAIAHIFNLSLSNGEFIDAFKVAKVEPVFKKGST